MSEQTVDPTADFLSREKTILGDDAELIFGQAINDPSPSISDPLLPPSTSPIHVALPSSPESQATMRAESPVPPAPIVETISEATRRWQAEFNQLLIERDRLEAQAHEATVTKAREEIDQFYEDYNKKREKVLQESRARQTQKLQDEVTGTFWEKVCKYIDLEEGKKGTKDVSRFQQLLGQLKYSKEEKV